jgi:hypothetical protein
MLREKADILKVEDGSLFGTGLKTILESQKAKRTSREAFSA